MQGQTALAWFQVDSCLYCILPYRSWRCLVCLLSSSNFMLRTLASCPCRKVRGKPSAKIALQVACLQLVGTPVSQSHYRQGGSRSAEAHPNPTASPRQTPQAERHWPASPAVIQRDSAQRPFGRQFGELWQHRTGPESSPSPDPPRLSTSTSRLG